MRNRRHSAVAGLALVAALWIGYPAPLSAARKEALRIGTLKKDASLVAIEANTVFVYCQDTDLLVLQPDTIRETLSSLHARVLEDGRWQLDSGRIVTPKEAAFQVGDETIGILPIVMREDVDFADTADTGECEQKIKGYKCGTTNQGGCNNSCEGTKLWLDGPAVFSYCVPGKADDRCTQTTGSVTCNFKNFQGPGCTGAVISSGSQSFPNCH